jgi:hypothetical protein
MIQHHVELTVISYLNFRIIYLIFQRPTAKELLHHPFLKKARRNNHLVDLIDRYKKWRLTNTGDSDPESDGDPDMSANDDDSEWNLTVKGRPLPNHEGSSMVESGSEPNLTQLSYLDHNRNDQPLGSDNLCCCCWQVLILYWTFLISGHLPKD